MELKPKSGAAGEMCHKAKIELLHRIGYNSFAAVKYN